MLIEYAQKLYGVYKEKGFVSAVKSFGKSFGEYFLLQANYIKLRQIQRDNKPFCVIPHISRVYAGAVTGQPFREITNQDLESIILETKTQFLNKIR